MFRVHAAAYMNLVSTTMFTCPLHIFTVKNSRNIDLVVFKIVKLN